LCGAVRYEASGQPYDVTHCHCADCRRRSGAAFVTWASFERSDFRFTEGEPQVVPWAGNLRFFCGACGTPLTLLTSVESEEIDVTVCTFDHAEAVCPGDHTWLEDQLPWVRLDDQLPGYNRHSPHHAG
jgi:hypothetical protein